jgi:hypothetical protein
MSSDLRLSSLSSDVGLRKPSLKERIAHKVLNLFGWSVLATVALTVALAGIDACMIFRDVIEPADRLVNQTVLMAMIGATVVELAAALATIVVSNFGAPPSKGESSDVSED